MTNVWEQRKLGELGEIMTGSTPSTSKTEYYSEDGIPWVTPTDINTQTISDTPRKLSEEGAKIGRIVPANTILCTCIASIGKNTLLTVKGSFNQQINSLTPNDENDAYCLLTESEIWSDKMKSMAASGTMQIINKTEFSELLTMVPKLKEQKKIGEYFRNLDHLITLHQRKCNQAEKLKKYMLQKMFPQNGEKNPEIRFDGFTDDWEQRKLADIYGSIGNAFVGTATPYYAEHGHFYLESNNVKDGQINHNAEIFINDEFYEKQKDKWLHTGDMVMVQSGHVGHAAVIPEELDNTAAHALIMFRNPKEEIEPYFLNYEYQTDKAKKQIENITTGNTIKHILASDMQEFVVDIPKYEEQKVIASYFCNLDHLITLHQRKCDELKKIKKFMLQNMFV